MDLGCGVTIVRSCDFGGNVPVISSTGLHASFQYDSAQRPTGMTDSDNAALSWTFGFDSLDRVSSARDAPQSLGCTYDANGNRLTQTGSADL
jgi:hypothetical protein